MTQGKGMPAEGAEESMAESSASSIAWADALCRRLQEPLRAFEFWDARYQKAQTVDYWKVQEATGFRMEYIIMQRAIYKNRIDEMDLINDFKEEGL